MEKKSVFGSALGISFLCAGNQTPLTRSGPLVKFWKSRQKECRSRKHFVSSDPLNFVGTTRGRGPICPNGTSTRARLASAVCGEETGHVLVAWSRKTATLASLGVGDDGTSETSHVWTSAEVWSCGEVVLERQSQREATHPCEEDRMVEKDRQGYCAMCV